MNGSQERNNGRLSDNICEAEVKTFRKILERAVWPRVMAIFVAVALFIVSATAYLPKSTVGLHCPTATIQSVEVVQVSKTCCGEIKKLEVRKPKMGEKEFKQCHCEDKKSANNHKEATGEQAPLVALLCPALCFELSEVPNKAVFQQPIRSHSAMIAPPIPPPPSAV